MRPFVASALRRLATILWSVAVVWVLGLTSWTSSAEAFDPVEPVDVVRDADPEPVRAPPPTSVELGEDAESEGSEDTDDVAGTDTDWLVGSSSEFATAIDATRRERLPAQVCGHQEHNRGPPQA